MKSGLDLEAPRGGRAGDAYAVACTATMLLQAIARPGDSGGYALASARHAVALHRLSGQLHRIAERECNGEHATCGDAYAVACTATMLLQAIARPGDSGGYALASARHAVSLHRLSGQLHRIAERECGEDLGCRECGGSGECNTGTASVHGRGDDYVCRKCAGTGSRIGKRLERLRQQCRDIAEHYGLRCYFQTDPRGCSLYLIDPATVPQSWAAVPGDPLEHYVYEREAQNPPTLATLQARWIDANYTRGHAVGRIGR